MKTKKVNPGDGIPCSFSRLHDQADAEHPARSGSQGGDWDGKIYAAYNPWDETIEWTITNHQSSLQTITKLWWFIQWFVMMNGLTDGLSDEQVIVSDGLMMNQESWSSDRLIVTDDEP